MSGRSGAAAAAVAAGGGLVDDSWLLRVRTLMIGQLRVSCLSGEFVTAMVK
jgi:hypothetical protein